MEDKIYTAQELRNCADNCDWRVNPSVSAMLSYAAAMVERCEKKSADIMARTYRHDIGWMGGDDKAVYVALGDVLRGDAGKEADNA